MGALTQKHLNKMRKKQSDEYLRINPGGYYRDLAFQEMIESKTPSDVYRGDYHTFGFMETA